MNLSLESLLATKKTIENQFGKEYALESPRYFKTKSKSAQEAHEAIRPTNPEKTPDEVYAIFDPSQYKLYKLIWNRTVACQMQPAKLKSVRAEIEAHGKKDSYLLKANGSTILFDGFLKVYGDKSPTTETFLPPLVKGDLLDATAVEALQKFTSAPPRYNEATLVKVLEEHGIGRPSTYAPTISTIIERKYVDKNEEKRLYPLEIGLLVNDILVEHFPEIVSIDFTAGMENDLDEVAEGKKAWVPVIRDFYEPFHKNIETKTKTVKKEEEVLDRNCPTCGSPLVVKFGRFGKFIACSKYPECKNIMKIEQKTGLKCPKCAVGDVVARKSKRGKMFYGCNKYPDCDFVMWNKTTGELCPKCKHPLAFAAKGKVACSNKECGYEQES